MTMLLPAQRIPLLRFLSEYNPFYLLSAMCMLFGVFALNDSLDWSPLPQRNLLRMIVTLNVYEGLLILLAIFLLGRGIRRDATMLFIIEAFFLVDVGFLNMEIFATDARTGLLVNLLVLGAAVVKVMLVFRAARLPLGDGRFACVLMQLAVLFAIPGIFAVIAQRHDNHLHPLAVYGGWWLAGLLPVGYAMLVGAKPVFRSPRDLRDLRWPREAAPGTIIARVLLVLPMLSIIAHLCLASWVYKVTFHPLNFAPLLLGLAVAIGHGDQQVATLVWRMRMQLVLPFVAVALSAIRFSPEMVFTFGGIAWSPLRFALLGAAAVYLDALWLHRHVVFALGAALWLTLAGMGHSLVAMNKNTVEAAQETTSAMARVMPRTLAEWGVVSVAAAFVLLALGAMISLLRRHPEPVLTDAREDETS